VKAAYWSLVVEMVEAAEKMTDLCVQDKLTGPTIRVMPADMSREAIAVMESPQGLIAHYYATDEQGLVKHIRVLDTAVENNALRCLLVRNIVKESGDSLQNPRQIKSRIETSLLPF